MKVCKIFRHSIPLSNLIGIIDRFLGIFQIWWVVKKAHESSLLQFLLKKNFQSLSKTISITENTIRMLEWNLGIIKNLDLLGQFRTFALNFHLGKSQTFHHKMSCFENIYQKFSTKYFKRMIFVWYLNPTLSRPSDMCIFSNQKFQTQIYLKSS